MFVAGYVCAPVQRGIRDPLREAPKLYAGVPI